VAKPQYTKTIIQLDRFISWVLVIVAALTIYSGYAMTRQLVDRGVMLQLHLIFEIAFIALLVTHIILTLFIPAHWQNLWRKFTTGSFTTANWLKLIQRLSGYVVIFTAGLVIVTGLSWYGLGLIDIFPFLQHIRYDLLLILTLLLHVTIGAHYALKRRHIKGNLINVSLIGFLAVSTLFISYWDTSRSIAPPTSGQPGTGGLPGTGTFRWDDVNPNIPPILIPDPPTNTMPVLEGTIGLGGTFYTFHPANITTVRPDIFNPGYFSLFDILVYLDNGGLIDMEYHFAEDMNTFVIDTIHDTPNWWYNAQYEGGWTERSNHRMDHYPWKDGGILSVYQESPEIINRIYDEYLEEIERLNANNGAIIIPRVVIEGNSFYKSFTNVSVRAHHLRSDMFRIGTITCIDVILSLAEQGHITYRLKWYETIAGSIVQNYWVEAIDSDYAFGTCGFVYETGYSGMFGNHIHLPSDSRILNSPEYVLYFWICL
jgi:hypothetical protein